MPRALHACLPPVQPTSLFNCQFFILPLNNFELSPLVNKPRGGLVISAHTADCIAACSLARVSHRPCAVSCFSTEYSAASIRFHSFAVSLFRYSSISLFHYLFLPVAFQTHKLSCYSQKFIIMIGAVARDQIITILSFSEAERKFGPTSLG